MSDMQHISNHIPSHKSIIVPASAYVNNDADFYKHQKASFQPLTQMPLSQKLLCMTLSLSSKSTSMCMDFKLYCAIIH